jgi:AcrR family transcriptional regulator
MTDEGGDSALARLMKTLPRQEWGLLSLVHRRGATSRELAAALGISRGTLRNRVSAAMRRARSPVLASLARQWGRLRPAERRLAYLHLVLGLSLREITRRGLMPVSGGDGRPASASALGRRLRRIERRFAATQSSGGRLSSSEAPPPLTPPDR